MASSSLRAVLSRYGPSPFAIALVEGHLLPRKQRLSLSQEVGSLANRKFRSVGKLRWKNSAGGLNVAQVWVGPTAAWRRDMLRGITADHYQQRFAGFLDWATTGHHLPRGSVIVRQPSRELTLTEVMAFVHALYGLGAAGHVELDLKATILLSPRLRNLVATFQKRLLLNIASSSDDLAGDLSKKNLTALAEMFPDSAGVAMRRVMIAGAIASAESGALLKAMAGALDDERLHQTSNFVVVAAAKVIRAALDINQAKLDATIAKNRFVIDALLEAPGLRDVAKLKSLAGKVPFVEKAANEWGRKMALAATKIDDPTDQCEGIRDNFTNYVNALGKKSLFAHPNDAIALHNAMSTGLNVGG